MHERFNIGWAMNKSQLVIGGYLRLSFRPFLFNMSSTGRHDRAVSQWLFGMAMGCLMTACAVICNKKRRH